MYTDDMSYEDAVAHQADICSQLDTARGRDREQLTWDLEDVRARIQQLTRRA
jgi:hypothetical protein